MHVLALFLAASVTVVRTGTPPIDVEAPKAYRPDRSSSLVGLMLPEPISPADAARWSDMITLSEPQHQIWVTEYARYVDAFEQLSATESAELWDASRELMSRRQIDAELAWHEELAELLGPRRDAHVRRLAGLDRRFFDSILPYLAESQAPILEQARLQRERSRHGAVLSRLPWAREDLVARVYAALERCDDDPSDRPALNELLFEYDVRMTPLARRRHEAQMRGITQGSVLLASLATDSVDWDDESSRSAHEDTLARARSLRRAVARACRRCLELNREFATRIEPQLPREARAIFTEGFLRSAFPRVYPDASSIVTDLASVLDSIPDSDLRESIGAIGLQYRSVRGRMNDEMIDLYVDWEEDGFVYLGRTAAERAQFEEAIQELEGRRYAQSAGTLREIVIIAGDALTAESRKLLTSRIATLDEHMSALSAAAATDGSGSR